MSNTWKGRALYSKDVTELMRDIARLNGKNPLITAACADDDYFYFLDQYERKVFKVDKSTYESVLVFDLTDEVIIYQRSWLANGTLDGSEWENTRACWADDSTGVFAGGTNDMKRWYISRWTIHRLGEYLIISEPIESTLYVYSTTGEYVTQFCIGWGGVSGSGPWGNGRFAHVLAVEEPDICYVSHTPYFGIRGAAYTPISDILYTRKYETIDGISYPELWGEAVMPRGHHDEMLAWPEDDPDWLNLWDPDWNENFVTNSPYFSKWTLGGVQLAHENNEWAPSKSEREHYVYTDENGGNDWFSPKYGHWWFRPTGGCVSADTFYVSAAGGYNYDTAYPVGDGTQHAVYALDKDTLKIESIACHGSNRFHTFIEGWPGSGVEPDDAYSHITNWSAAQAAEYGFVWQSDTLWNYVADASVGCFLHPYHDALVNVSNCGWVVDNILANENKVPNIHYQMHWLWPSTLFTDGDRAYLIVNRMPWSDHAVNTGTVWDDNAGGTATIPGRSTVNECYMISYDLTTAGAEWANKKILRVRSDEQTEWHKYFANSRESIGNSPEDDALVGSYTSIENLLELRIGLEEAATSLRTPHQTFLSYYKDDETEIEQPNMYYPLFGPEDGEGERYCIGEAPADSEYADVTAGDVVLWEWNTAGRSCYIPVPESVTSYETIYADAQWIHDVVGPFDGGIGGISLTRIMFSLPTNDGPLRMGHIYMDGVEYTVAQGGAPGAEERASDAASQNQNVYYLAMAPVETEYGLQSGVTTSTSSWRRAERAHIVRTPTYDIDIGELREIVDYLLAREDAEDIVVLDPPADEVADG